MMQDAIIDLIIIVVIVGIAFTLLVYFRNKQNDRSRHRRERLEEKHEELMETLRKKTDENKADEN
jgi:hypothetical protein